MLLHTPLYLLFLGLVVICFWQLPTWNSRKALLVITSAIFYLTLDWRFCLLLVILILVTYYVGIMLPHNRHARRYFLLHLVICLGILAIFKYAGFFLENISMALRLVGVDITSPTLTIILPIGISFYTFQAIGYVYEIYKEKIQPTSEVVDIALMLGFFPKIIAGPLVRPENFLNQLRNHPSPPDKKELRTAGSLLVFGMVKKVLIADSLCVLADTAYRAAEMAVDGAIFPTPLYLQGFYLFAFQIYADFSGYTDIARGSAMLLGFKLPENFQQPYWSISITDFWNRWHISLTQWFREHLYFPFSRWLYQQSQRRYRSLVQTTANLVTMSLIGLWHGAAWTFVIWGLWHGLCLSLDGLLRTKPKVWWQRIVGGVITFHLVGFGWVLFRAQSFQTAKAFLQGLFNMEQMHWFGYYLLPVVFIAILVTIIDVIQLERIQRFVIRQDFVYQTGMIAGVVIVIMLALLRFAHGNNALPFIYGNF